MRRADNRPPILDVLLEFREKIGPRVAKAVQRIWTLPIKYPDFVLKDLKRTLDLPGVVPRVIIVRRDRDDDSGCFGRLKQAPEIRNDVVLRDTFTYDRPRFAFRTHEIDLRVNNNQGRSRDVQLHIAFL